MTRQGAIWVAAHESTSWNDAPILKAAEEGKAKLTSDGTLTHNSSGWEDYDGVNIYVHRFTITE